MPKLKEAAVTASGQVLQVEELSNFDTKKYEGLKVIVATTDGFLAVKLDVDAAALLNPQMFGQVAWVVRPSGWSRDGGTADISYRFVREVAENDLELLASVASSKASAKS